jgi:hypothetical protein
MPIKFLALSIDLNLYFYFSQMNFKYPNNSFYRQFVLNVNSSEKSSKHLLLLGLRTHFI